MTIGNELLFLSANQAQAVDALRLLLDGLDHEGQTVTEGRFAAESFKGRLRLYLGALHFVMDGLEANGKRLEDLAEKMDNREEAET